MAPSAVVAHATCCMLLLGLGAANVSVQVLPNASLSLLAVRSTLSRTKGDKAASHGERSRFTCDGWRPDPHCCQALLKQGSCPCPDSQPCYVGHKDLEATECSCVAAATEAECLSRSEGYAHYCPTGMERTTTTTTPLSCDLAPGASCPCSGPSHGGCWGKRLWYTLDGSYYQCGCEPADNGACSGDDVFCPAISTTSATTTPATTTQAVAPSSGGREWELVAGSGNLACRGDNATDNRPEHYELHSEVATLEQCQARCLSQLPRCKGVEHSPESRRCELWTRAEGLYATGTPGTSGSFTCQRYGWPAKYLQPMDGGEGRACRGDGAADNSPSYYEVTSRASSLDDCRARCVAARVCRGLEFHPNGRCEIWTRAIGASAPVAGYTCLRYKHPVSQ